MENPSYLKDSGKTTTPMREADMTKAVTKPMAKIPASYFLAAAGGVFVLSLGMALTSRRKDWANLVGNWVPSLILLGIYNKNAKPGMTSQTEQSPLH